VYSIGFTMLRDVTQTFAWAAGVDPQCWRDEGKDSAGMFACTSPRTA
jgi:hypothetical protein